MAKRKKFKILPEYFNVGDGLRIMTKFPEETLTGKKLRQTKPRISKRKQRIGLANIEGLAGGIVVGSAIGGVGGGMVGGVTGLFGANAIAKQMIPKRKKRR